MPSAREELRRLAAEDNLSCESVVATAADPGNVLNPYFEWDDSVAGHKYRLVQAADLIRSYRVEYRETPSGPRTVREFTSTREAGYADTAPGKYVPTEEVLRDERATEFLLQGLKREVARRGTAGLARLGAVRQGAAWQAWLGLVWQGMARRGTVGPGTARPGVARRGVARHGRLGKAKRGSAGCGRQGGSGSGKAGQGTAWQGLAWQVRHGSAG